MRSRHGGPCAVSQTRPNAYRSSASVTYAFLFFFGGESRASAWAMNDCTVSPAMKSRNKFFGVSPAGPSSLPPRGFVAPSPVAYRNWIAK